MENNLTRNDAGQEIDLWDILQKFGRWGAKFVLAFVTLLVKKSVWLVCFALAGLAAGSGLYFVSNPYYSANMCVQVNVADNFFYVTLINENLSPRNITDSRDLSQKLNIPENIAKQVRAIWACYGVDLNKDGFPDMVDEENKYFFSNDSLKAAKVLHGLMYINVQVYSQEALSYLNQSIVEFINKNKYVQSHNARRIADAHEQISYLQQQVKWLDSLQQYEYFQKGYPLKNTRSGQFLIWNEQQQSLYHSDLLSLNNEILSKYRTLELYSEPITILQDFVGMSRRKNNLMFYAKPLIVNFSLIGLIFLIIWDYRKLLVKLYRKKVAVDFT
jgi:hypothetical protein